MAEEVCKRLEHLDSRSPEHTEAVQGLRERMQYLEGIFGIFSTGKCRYCRRAYCHSRRSSFGSRGRGALMPDCKCRQEEYLLRMIDG